MDSCTCVMLGGIWNDSEIFGFDPTHKGTNKGEAWALWSCMGWPQGFIGNSEEIALGHLYL